MPWCSPCDRYFNTDNGYNQHMMNSVMHLSQRMDPEWECEDCGREFYTEKSLHQHCSTTAGHPYCISCKRMFKNENNLTQHLHSRIHVGRAIKCPFCTRSFTTASGVTIHLESGTCTSGIDRYQINETIRRLDRQNVITKPMITMPGYDRNPIETFATERAWNGRAYGCYLCPRQFASLNALNKHFNSPVHEEDIYRCPKAGCGRTYKLLSGLVAHFESETCGFMKFDSVQKQARNGVENMVGRMIGNGR